MMSTPQECLLAHSHVYFVFTFGLLFEVGGRGARAQHKLEAGLFFLVEIGVGEREKERREGRERSPSQ